MRGAVDACRGWLLLTAVMGLSFLGGQMVEYFELPLASPTTSTPAPSMP